MEHYDPAYRRSSLHNFVRLREAEHVAIGIADERAFEAAARELLEDTVSA